MEVMVPTVEREVRTGAVRLMAMPEGYRRSDPPPGGPAAQELASVGRKGLNVILRYPSA